MDAEYLRSSLTDVVAKGCAATIAVAPVDPIEYLSLWLLKHVENEHISVEIFKEREQCKQAQMMKQEEHSKKITQEDEQKKKQTEAINQLRSIKDDPYLLWDTSLKAILTFTGSSSVYIALLMDRPWEPPRTKKGTEQGEAAETDEGEKGTEEEEKQDEEEEGANAEPEEVEKADEIKQNEDGSDSQSNVPKKKAKAPNYNKKILLYVAATPENSFMINKQMDKKLGPVTFKAILQGPTRLHVPNVLYQEGINFFQGIPAVGAYFVIPIALNTTPIQITAVLCADTLKKEGLGSGRPFSAEEQNFLVSASQAIGDVMTDISKLSTNTADTENVMKILRDRIQKTNSRYENDIDKSKRAMELESQNKNQGSSEQTEEQTTPKDSEDNGDLIEDNNLPASDAKREETEANEDAEEEEEEEDESKKQKDKDMEMKKQRKLITKLEQTLSKYRIDLEKRAARVSKLQKQLEQSGRSMLHFQARLSAVVDVITELKDQEFLQVKRWSFPPMLVHRILKAVLCVLGNSKDVIGDWTRARKMFDDNICSALRSYDPLKQSLSCWDFCDICLEGITEEMLSKEAAIGYVFFLAMEQSRNDHMLLGQQWLVAAKDMTTASVKHQKLKLMYENEAKSFADLELEKMIAEIDLRAAVNEENRFLHTPAENKKASEEVSNADGEVTGDNKEEQLE